MVQALAIAVFIVALVVFGIFAFLWRRRAERRALASRLQATDGLLQDIGCRKIRQQDNTGHYWVVYTAYEYSVGDQRFRGSRTSLDTDTFTSEAGALSAIGGRKAGDKVVVWYDPASPARSALQRLAPAGAGFYPVAAIAAGIVAVAAVIVAYLSR
jgi:hypothetical protein